MFRVDMRLRPFGDSGPLDRERRVPRGLSADARPRLGALRLGQGARDHGAASACEGHLRGERAAVRLSPLPRLRRVREPARDEGADRAGGRAPRARRAREARSRRHPRDRVHRAGVPAHPRRTGSAHADAVAADGAAAARRRQAAAGARGAGTRGRLRVPAPAREPPADAGGRADAHAFRRTR